MLNVLRIITTLSGLGLLLVGVLWWLQPAAAAEILGASLLDGAGRSTQIGDSARVFHRRRRTFSARGDAQSG